MTQQLQQLLDRSYEYVAETGVIVRVLELTSESHVDHITIQFHPDDDVAHQMQLHDSPDESGETTTLGFTDAGLSFNPITVIGKQQTDLVEGLHLSSVTTMQSDETVPTANTPLSNHEQQLICESWQSLGFTVVPPGDEWIL